MISDSLSSANLMTQLHEIFKKQTVKQFQVANTSVRERRRKLTLLHDALLKNKAAIREAMYQDFKKHPSEVDLSEIFPVSSEIKYTKSRLGGWMRPEAIRTPVALSGTRSWVRYEPKGVVLIISPWNFPVNLTFGPLISALAAGNCVILNPSELTEHTSLIMEKIIKEIFDPAEVCLVTGGIEVSKGLLELPFDHIFFTGSPSVGKIVMKKAAQHLTSITLELGGKSPTIIDKTANLKKAAKRISWGKFINKGQVCLAPDYLLVHEEIYAEFIQLLKGSIEDLYGNNPKKSKSYPRIVNERHFNRLKDLLDDVQENEDRVVIGGQTQNNEQYIAPTIVQTSTLDSNLMTKEIFGPILPVITFQNLTEAVEIIQRKEKPLALYIYSRSKKNIQYVLNHTRAGGTCINHNVIHFFNHHLPFGGTKHSGFGKSHGKYGFQAFSNPRAVLKQNWSFSGIDLMMPPYTDFKQRIIDFAIKWF